MSVYTVHEPPLRSDEASAAPDRFEFVRDGFYFWAFLLGPVWMLWRRLWLVLIGYAVLMAVLHAVLWVLRASDGVEFAVMLLVALLVGMEAASLRRFTLARRGFRQAGVVVADERDAAERRFFDAWSRDIGQDMRSDMRADLAGAEPARPARASMPRMPRGGPEVVGLFPEPGGQR